MAPRRTPAAVGPALLALLLCGGGCHIYQSATVNVRDAETGAPVDGGVVRTSHVPWGFYPKPRSVRRSVVNGRAKVQVVHGSLPQVHITAPGYNPVTENVLSWSRSGGNLPPVNAAMYREPAPHIVIELPDGFTGVVRVGMKYYAHDEKPYPTGQRVFPIRAGEPGILWLPATPLVWRMPPESFRAMYPDGRTPPTIIQHPYSRPAEVALRRLRDDSLSGLPGGRGMWVHFFFVGTGPDASKAQVHRERVNTAGELFGASWDGVTGTPATMPAR